MAVSIEAPAQSMNRLQMFFLNIRRILKISTKPSRKEYFTLIKVCLIGLGILGLLSYIVQLIASVISPQPQTQT